jgi:periplasmic divalent cation tolerance protein
MDNNCNSNFAMIYVTAADHEQALAIGKALVSARLVACANVLPSVNSVYWWDDAVQEGQEAVLIAKTTAALVDVVIAKVRELHTYSCPCVVALPIIAGNPDFLSWIAAETTQP